MNLGSFLLFISIFFIKNVKTSGVFRCKQLGITNKDKRICLNGEHLPGGAFYMNPTVTYKCLCIYKYYLAYASQVKMINTMGNIYIRKALSIAENSTDIDNINNYYEIAKELDELEDNKDELEMLHDEDIAEMNSKNNYLLYNTNKNHDSNQEAYVPQRKLRSRDTGL